MKFVKRLYHQNTERSLNMQYTQLVVQPKKCSTRALSLEFNLRLQIISNIHAADGIEEKFPQYHRIAFIVVSYRDLRVMQYND